MPELISQLRIKHLCLWFVSIVCLISGGSGVAAGRVKYYIHLRDVVETSKATCGLKEAAEKQLLRVLRKNARVTTSLGKRKLKGRALAAALKARKLSGYDVILRIVHCSHRILPPRPGRVHRVLEVEVRTALHAEKLPSASIAGAGDGSARVATEINRVTEAELRTLRFEALSVAVDQATKKFLAGLDADGKPHVAARKQKKRTRRGR